MSFNEPLYYHPFSNRHLHVSKHDAFGQTKPHGNSLKHGPSYIEKANNHIAL